MGTNVKEKRKTSLKAIIMLNGKIAELKKTNKGFRRDLYEEIVESQKWRRRYEIMQAEVGYAHDLEEYLLFIVTRAKSIEEMNEKMKEFREFQKRIYNSLLEKRKSLSSFKIGRKEYQV